MAKKSIHALQVITANDLLSGAVVYLSASEQWVADINLAQVFESGDEAQRVVSSHDDAKHRVVGINAIGVRLTEGAQVEPVLYREHLRLHGPSVSYHNATHELR